MIFSILSYFKLVVKSTSCIFVSEDLSEDSDCLPRFPPPLLETVFVVGISFFAGRSEEAILLRTDFRPPPPESTHTNFI